PPRPPLFPYTTLFRSAATEYLDDDTPAYRSYYPRRKGVRSTLIDLVLDFRLERRFADFRRDVRNVLNAVRKQLPRPFVPDVNLRSEEHTSELQSLAYL